MPERRNGKAPPPVESGIFDTSPDDKTTVVVNWTLQSFGFYNTLHMRVHDTIDLVYLCVNGDVNQ